VVISSLSRNKGSFVKKQLNVLPLQVLSPAKVFWIIPDNINKGYWNVGDNTNIGFEH